jgi:hypothetical protein
MNEPSPCIGFSVAPFILIVLLFGRPVKAVSGGMSSREKCGRMERHKAMMLGRVQTMRKQYCGTT